MPKILITGGAGFIGSSLADGLLNDPSNYLVLMDNLLTGRIDNLPDSQNSNWTFVQGDVNNFNDIMPVMAANSFDFVFHYAAVVGVQRTLTQTLLVLKDLEGIRNILELSKNTGVKRVFFASSSEVYGESISFPQDEVNTPLNSRLPYAVVKNAGEAFCASYAREYGLSSTIFRFFNTYGPKQSTDFVMSKFLKAALHNQPVTIYGNGSQTRTFCYIDDNIAACIAALNNKKYINEVVNIGNAEEITILHLAKTIIALSKSSSEIIYLPPLLEGDMPRRLPHLVRMQNLLNRSHTPLEKGIEQLINSGRF